MRQPTWNLESLRLVAVFTIAVTAFGKNYYKKAIEAGCNDLIDKPVDFDSLEPILRCYLAH